MGGEREGYQDDEKKCCKNPPCCVAVWINVVLLLVGIALIVLAGLFMFHPQYYEVARLYYAVLIPGFILGVLLVVVNVLGFIVAWAVTSETNDGCCDNEEQFFGKAGWITYVVLKVLLLCGTVVMAGILTFILIKNDPNSTACPGIEFSKTTECRDYTCQEGNKIMRWSDCPVDYLVMENTQASQTSTSWQSLQNTFTMCGYYCGGKDCDISKPEIVDLYGFQTTGKYCYENGKSQQSDLAKQPLYYTGSDVSVALPGRADNVTMVDGASITGIRDSFQQAFTTYGIIIDVLLFVAMFATLANLICFSILVCRFHKDNRERGYRGKTRPV